MNEKSCDGLRERIRAARTQIEEALGERLKSCTLKGDPEGNYFSMAGRTTDGADYKADVSVTDGKVEAKVVTA